MCSYPKNITFVVHSPDEPKNGAEFCKKYSIGFYNSNTNWCGSSLIYVFLQCIKKIIDMYKSYDEKQTCIYLVSGSDIPIVPADALFGLVSLQEDGEKNKQPYDSKICQIRKFKSDDNYEYNVDAQWVALNLKDAKALYKIMIKDKVFYFLKQKWLEDLRKEKDMIRCPDNHFISTAINWNKKTWLEAGGSKETFNKINNPGKHTCIVTDPRSGKSGPSPVLWKGEDDVVYIFGEECFKSNLETVIQMYRTFDGGNEKTFFIRKVDSGVKVIKNLEYYINPTTSYIDIYNKLGTSIDKVHFNQTDLYDAMEKHKCIKPTTSRVDEFNERMISIYNIKNKDKNDIISIISLEKQLDDELQLESFDTPAFKKRANSNKNIQRYIDIKKIT